MPDDAAAYAANWRNVLAADLAVGVLAAVGGVVLAFAWSPWWSALAVCGAVYLFFVGGRIAKWRRLRRESGLDS